MTNRVKTPLSTGWFTNYVTQKAAAQPNSFVFFLECFIPSSPEDVSEAHPTPFPKFTAPAVTQEAFGAGFAGSLTFSQPL